MGLTGSKEDKTVSDAELLRSLGGTSSKYGKLLLDPVVQRKFGELYELVDKNRLNDINYLVKQVASFNKEQLPVLQALSDTYEKMLEGAVKLDPVGLKDRTDRFVFLSNDQNIMRYFLFTSGDEGVPMASLLTGHETSPTLHSIKDMVDSLKLRNARLLYYQFKFAQASLFQAAFAQSMWTIATVFVDQTAAFHKARETVFQSVLRQMFGIFNKYAGSQIFTDKEVDDLETIKRKMDDTKKLVSVKDKLDKQKMDSLHSLLGELVQLGWDPQTSATHSSALAGSPFASSAFSLTPPSAPSATSVVKSTEAMRVYNRLNAALAQKQIEVDVLRKINNMQNENEVYRIESDYKQVQQSYKSEKPQKPAYNQQGQQPWQQGNNHSQ